MNKNHFRTDHVLVDAQNISKSFGDNVVLTGLDLEIRDLRILDVKQAQVVSLLGPSGIGKSTFFRIMAGLEKMDEGELFIDNPHVNPKGEKITRQNLIPTQSGMVGMVYQDYRFFNFHTVEQCLREGLKNSRNPLDNKKVEDYLIRFGLLDHRKKFHHQLSGGQKQRVAIAQQLIRSPQLLVMDEPFSGLDPETKGDVVDLINDIATNDEYLTILIISHDILSSLKVSDTVYFMGRNRDALGNISLGASIHHNMTIDMAERGLAWHNNDKYKLREMADLELQINEKFPYLSGAK